MWTSVSLVLACFIASSFAHHKKGHNVGFKPTLGLVPGEEVILKNYITYYMYNITNPDEFEAGEKPELDEVGPYVYLETRRKFNITKISDSVMQYAVSKYWEFMPELSEGHEESDEFNVINIPMVILATKLSTKGLPKVFNDILVDELLEKGDTLVRRNEEIGNVIYHGMNVSIYTEILHDVLQGNVPPEYSNNRFALFKDQNGTIEGTFQVRTRGPHMGDILTYNNKSSLDYWGGDLCNRIDGTDGYFFRPGMNEKSTLKIFYPELCRSVYLRPDGRKMYEGIETLKFSFPEDMLEDPAVNPENVCFCSKPLQPTNNSMASCLKRGFIDYAGCKQESPLLISYPHFLYADPVYQSQVLGLDPNPEKHESEFLVEPHTGAILSGTRRFQFNVKLRPLDNVEMFKNTTFMIFPVFNTERKMIIQESRVEQVKEDLKKIAENQKDDNDLYGANQEHDDSVHDHDYPNDEGSTDKNTVAGQTGDLQENKNDDLKKGSSNEASSIYHVNTIKYFAYISVALHLTGVL